MTISESTREMLMPLYEKGCWALEMSLAALAEADRTLALGVVEAEDSLEQFADSASEHLARRLIADAPNRLETFRLESELIENLKRVFYLAKRIAEVLVRNGNHRNSETALVDE